MNIETLLSINKPTLLYVTAKSELTIKNLVRAKKEACGSLDTLSQDINNDGVVNANDISLIRESLLEN